METAAPLSKATFAACCERTISLGALFGKKKHERGKKSQRAECGSAEKLRKKSVNSPAKAVRRQALSSVSKGGKKEGGGRTVALELNSAPVGGPRTTSSFATIERKKGKGEILENADCHS